MLFNMRAAIVTRVLLMFPVMQMESLRWHRLASLIVKQGFLERLLVKFRRKVVNGGIIFHFQQSKLSMIFCCIHRLPAMSTKKANTLQCRRLVRWRERFITVHGCVGSATAWAAKVNSQQLLFNLKSMFDVFLWMLQNGRHAAD